jgi:hypothetical protein
LAQLNTIAVPEGPDSITAQKEKNYEKEQKNLTIFMEVNIFSHQLAEILATSLLPSISVLTSNFYRKLRLAESWHAITTGDNQCHKE